MRQEIAYGAIPRAQQYGVTVGSYDELPEAVVCMQPGGRVKTLPSGLRMGRPGMGQLPTAGREWAIRETKDYLPYRDKFYQAALALAGYNDSDVRALHNETFRKFVPESGYAPGWYGRLSKMRPTALPFRQETIRALTAMLESRDGEFPPYKTTVKTGSNHGWPTYQKSDMDHLVHFAIADELRQDLSSYDKLIQELQSRMDLDPAHEPSALLLSRTGPIAKAQGVFTFVDGRLAKVADCLGWFPRRRDVNGVMSWLNEVARHDAMVVTSTLKKYYSFNHVTPEKTMHEAIEIADNIRATTGKEPWIGSDDASAFDDSISRTHILQVAGCYPRWATRLKWLEDKASELPLLVGPFFQGDAGYMLKRSGTVLSGVVTTTLMDNIVNFAILLEVLGDMLFDGPFSAYLAWREKKWGVWIQGDDTLLVLPEELDREDYLARCKALGYDRKIKEATVFLMTWFNIRDKGSRNYLSYHGIASRAATRTITREHAAPGPATELLGALLRWERCQGDPLFDDFWHLINDNALFTEYGVESYSDLKRLAESTTFLRRCEGEVQGTPQGLERWIKLINWATGQFGLATLGSAGRTAFEYMGGVKSLLDNSPDFRDLEDQAGSLNWRAALTKLAQTGSYKDEPTDASEHESLSGEWSDVAER